MLFTKDLPALHARCICLIIAVIGLVFVSNCLAGPIASSGANATLQAARPLTPDAATVIFLFITGAGILHFQRRQRTRPTAESV